MAAGNRFKKAGASAHKNVKDSNITTTSVDSAEKIERNVDVAVVDSSINESMSTESNKNEEHVSSVNEAITDTQNQTNKEISFEIPLTTAPGLSNDNDLHKKETVEDNKKATSKEAKKTTKSKKADVAMTRKSVSLSELDTFFLGVTSRRNRKPIQEVLAQILNDELSTQRKKPTTYTEDKLIRFYSSRLKNPKTSTVALEDTLIEDVLDMASIMGLTWTGFVAYSVTKARRKNKEFMEMYCPDGEE